MKKIWVLVFLLVLLILPIVYAQISTGQLEDTIEGLEEKIEEFEEKKENIEEDVEKIKETKWDYLGEEWKEILLKNKFVSFVDGFLKKISFVFVVLFGESYSLSLTLFLIICLWLYFFFKFTEIFRDYSSFSSSVAMGIGFCLTIVLAQLKVLKQIVEFFGWLVFSQEANWLRFIIVLVIFLVMVILYKVTSGFGENFKKNKEQMEKERAKVERGILHNFVDAIMKGLRD